MSDLVVETEEQIEESEHFLGALDIVLLVLLAVVSIYYFLFRDRNRKDESAINSITVS